MYMKQHRLALSSFSLISPDFLPKIPNRLVPILFIQISQNPEFPYFYFVRRIYYATLENPAVRAPVACAKNVQSADPVASRRRHAADTGPEPPDNTTYTLLR